MGRREGQGWEVRMAPAITGRMEWQGLENGIVANDLKEMLMGA